MLNNALEFAFIKLCLKEPGLWGYGFKPVDPIAGWMVDKVFEYRGKYNKYPNQSTLLEFLRPECGPQQGEIIEGAFSQELDRDFVKESVVKYVEEQRVRRAIHDGGIKLDEGDVQGAKALLSEGLVTLCSPAFDYFKDEAKHTRHDPVSTGLANLDGIMLGGMRKRKLGLVMGPRSSGKSMVLLNLGVGAMYHGCRVLHITMEDSLESVVRRYDSRLSGFGGMPVKRVQGLYGGNLMIKEFMTGEATVADMCSYMTPKPDLVLVDYLDEVKPSRQYKNRRHELGDVARGLRAMAQRYDCAVWTAKQTGRGTKFSAEVSGAETSFEGYEPVQVADVAVVINQTLEEKQRGEMRLLLDKNKDGPDGQSVMFQVDYKRMLLRVARGG